MTDSGNPQKNLAWNLKGKILSDSSVMRMKEVYDGFVLDLLQMTHISSNSLQLKMNDGSMTMILKQMLGFPNGSHLLPPV